MRFSKSKRIMAAFFGIIMLITLTTSIYATSDVSGIINSMSSETSDKIKMVEAPKCTCGDGAPENLAYHADGCERKQFVKSLISNKTAKQIYDDWAMFSKETRTDVLNILEAYVFTTYWELLDLVRVDVTEIMDSFVESVEAIPEVEEITTFDDAETSYAEIFAMADVDSIISPDETEIYEAAYTEYAKALGKSQAEIAPSYPATDLEDELRNEVTAALELLDKAEEEYALINNDESQTRSSKAGSVIDIDEKYATAYEKIEAILEVKPDLLENEPATVAETNDHKIASVAENIQMYLFNYGPLINTQQDGQGFLRFTHSEGQYGWAVDSTGEIPAENAGGWATLNTTLTSSFPVPYISSNISNGDSDIGKIKAGSLAYLLDHNHTTGRIDYNAYKSNLSSLNTSGPNPYQYHSICFPISNSDGSGTGLFQKDGSYFYYDSAKNAAWYNNETKKFEIYDYVLRPAYTAYTSDTRNGNFLPFNKGHETGREDYQTETYTKTYTYDGKEYTSANISLTDTVSTKPADASTTAYRLWGNSRSSEVDLWFGLALQFDFYQPKNGIKDGEPMTFEFLGDDDVFVYIDDVLILDIGGTHGAQTGKIDFKTGVVNNPSGYGQYGGNGKTTSTLYELMKAALGSSLDASQFIDSDGDGNLDTFKDYTNHTLKFYYLERGGNISYCRLWFNIDPLPNGDLSIEKKLSNVNSAIEDDQTYNFTVSAKDANNASFNGMTYQTITNGVADETSTVNDGGIISLKANQKAIFTNLKAGVTLKLSEQTNAQTESLSWSVNGKTQSGNSAQATLAESTDSASFSFVCTNTRKTGSMTIEKLLVGDEYKTDDEFEIKVSVGGQLYTGTATKQDGTAVKFNSNGIAKLKASDKITITQIPAGLSYTVEEILPSIGSEYLYETPIYENSSGLIVYNDVVDVTVTNTLKLLYGSLTVRKQGISSLDHNEDKQQSSIFEINGVANSGEIISLEVAVVGNSSVTVDWLPVGTYTVTEKTDWSWRYIPEKEVQSTLVKGNETSELTFKNSRTKGQWLSGDSYCENIWKKKDEEEKV